MRAAPAFLSGAVRVNNICCTGYQQLTRLGRVPGCILRGHRDNRRTMCEGCQFTCEQPQGGIHLQKSLSAVLQVEALWGQWLPGSLARPLGRNTAMLHVRPHCPFCAKLSAVSCQSPLLHCHQQRMWSQRLNPSMRSCFVCAMPLMILHAHTRCACAVDSKKPA